ADGQIRARTTKTSVGRDEELGVLHALLNRGAQPIRWTAVDLERIVDIPAVRRGSGHHRPLIDGVHCVADKGPAATNAAEVRASEIEAPVINSHRQKKAVARLVSSRLEVAGALLINVVLAAGMRLCWRVGDAHRNINVRKRFAGVI